MGRHIPLGVFLLVTLSPVIGPVWSEPGSGPTEGAAIDLDWDWGDPAASADPAPGGREGTSAVAPTPEPAATGGWSGDWGGDWGGDLDPAPGVGGSGPADAAPAPGPSRPVPAPVGAFPDYAAEPRPGIALFPGAPPFQVIPSTRDPELHPCRDCHEWAQSDPTPRPLKEPHNNFALVHGLHGEGEFWCFTCHHLEGDGGLRTLEGNKVDFGDAYVVCSQCHSQEARDWVFGAHGKRVGHWRGARKILNCTACHYQHAPALAGQEPKPPPPVRQGLARPPRPAGVVDIHGQPKPWEQGRGGH